MNHSLSSNSARYTPSQPSRYPASAAISQPSAEVRARDLRGRQLRDAADLAERAQPGDPRDQEPRAGMARPRPRERLRRRRERTDEAHVGDERRTIRIRERQRARVLVEVPPRVRVELPLRARRLLDRRDPRDRVVGELAILVGRQRGALAARVRGQVAIALLREVVAIRARDRHVRLARHLDRPLAAGREQLVTAIAPRIGMRTITGPGVESARDSRLEVPARERDRRRAVQLADDVLLLRHRRGRCHMCQPNPIHPANRIASLTGDGVKCGKIGMESRASLRNSPARVSPFTPARIWVDTFDTVPSYATEIIQCTTLEQGYWRTVGAQVETPAPSMK